MVRMKVNFFKKLIAWPLLIAILVSAVFTGMKFIPDTIARATAGNEAGDLVNLEFIAVGDNILQEATEFEVNSPAGIIEFATLVNSGIDFNGKTIYLTSDIDDMLDVAILGFQYAIGTNANPFRGTFDGCGFTVNLIDIFAASNNPIGFFGTTDGAVIKNLVIDNGKEEIEEVIHPIENIINCAYFGAVVGEAKNDNNEGKNTIIINSVNKADITNSTSGGTAAGIIAKGDENTRIINCFNYGKISANNVAGIIGEISDVPEFEDVVSLCVNLGELEGILNEDANVENWLEFETEDWLDLYGMDIEDGWGSLDIEDKKEIVTIFNTRIHELKHTIREYETEIYENRLFLFYWGFDIEDDTYLALCFPRTYIEYMIQKGVREEDDEEEEEFNSVMPLLGMNLMSEFLSKNAAAGSIAMWFNDSYAFITGDEDYSITAKNNMQEAYFKLLVDLEDMSIGDDTGDITKIFSFAKEVEKFVKYACEGVIDGIFYTWEEWYEGQYEDAIFEFAEGIITNWYEDCKSFITGDDEDAIDAREALLVKYNERISGLDEIEFSDNNELLIKINVYILVSLNELDDIYYSWELGVSWAALNEAYEDILNSAKDKSKVKEIYDLARVKINDAWEVFETYDNEEIDGERINKWIEYTGAVDDAVSEAVAQFDELKQQWASERTTTIWVSVSAAIVVLAGVVVTILLLNNKKKEKNYKAIIVEIQNDRKNKKIWEKADRITNENEARREKEEQRADAYRVQAEQILKEHREKAEKATHLHSEANVRLEADTALEKLPIEKKDQMAEAHKEKALAAKKSKKK